MAKFCFALFALCLVAYVTTRENFPQENSSNLVKFVCDLSKDFVKVEKNVKTIAIIKYKSEYSVEMIDEITQCMPKDVGLVVMDYEKEQVSLKHLRVSLIIMLTDKVEQIDIVTWLLWISDPILSHHSKFLLIAKNSDRIYENLQNFHDFGALDVTATYQVNSTAYVRRIYPYKKTKARKNMNDIENPTNWTFPDKLKDVYGYQFKVGFMLRSYIRVNENTSSVDSLFLHFLDATSKAMNGSYVTRRFAVDDAGYEEFSKAMSQREVDISLSHHGSEGLEKVLSYEETAYCVFVPRPEKSLLLQIMLIEPFELRIWMAFVGSVLCGGIVWRLYKNHGAVDSGWYFIFGILTFFIGQSVAFRSTRRALVVIIQIFMFATIILNCLYEGEMTSFMTTPFVERQLKTVEEFSKSDYKVSTNDFFGGNFSAKNYPEIHKRIIKDDELTSLPCDETRKLKIAFIIPCETFTRKFHYLIFDNLNEHYYLLPEVILPYYRFYDTSVGNPFVERWQRYMDWSFAGGLHSHWNFLLSQEFSFKHERESIKEENSYLKLSDMKQLFIIFGVGLALATLAFIGEVFYFYIKLKFY